MFDNQKFRASTWRLDAIAIWGSAGFGLFTWVVSLFEGKSVAVSMLLAAAALPLAFLTIVLLRNHKQIIVAVTRWVSALGNEQTKKEETPKKEDQTEGEEHERLQLFILDFVQPACDAQTSLQREILKVMCDNEKVLYLAEQGLTNDYMHRDFCDNLKKIASFGNSPMPVMTNREMIECIVRLENENYKEFCDQADKLSESANIDCRRYSVLGQCQCKLA